MEKLLETMLMQMLDPPQNTPSVICCNCFKWKTTDNQLTSGASSKCFKSGASSNHRRRRRKLRKSCLRTIVCVSMIAKDRRECEGCSCALAALPRQNITNNHERCCSNCVQMLPGEPINDHQQLEHYQHELEHCQQQLKRHQVDCSDVGVQVNLQHEEPLTVRIKVCPCPNNKYGSKRQRLGHSESDSELSQINSRLVEEGTTDNLATTVTADKCLQDDHKETSAESISKLDGLNETFERPDVARIKRLALKMAMAQMVQGLAYWKSNCTHQLEEQSLLNEIVGEPSENVASSTTAVQARNSASDGFRGPGILARLCDTMRNAGQSDGQVETNSRLSDRQIKMSTATDQYPTATGHNGNQQLIIRGRSDAAGNAGTRRNIENVAVGSCDETSAYCYNPENGFIGQHCELACACGNFDRFHPCYSSRPCT